MSYAKLLDAAEDVCAKYLHSRTLEGRESAMLALELLVTELRCSAYREAVLTEVEARWLERAKAQELGKEKKANKEGPDQRAHRPNVPRLLCQGNGGSEKSATVQQFANLGRYLRRRHGEGKFLDELAIGPEQDQTG